ncbi:MAG TPA: DUF4037 domain-containing protein [Anaerolineae bacterium]|nr:DUF4037 domain-containing protein [Anaerolineae bacterium]
MADFIPGLRLSELFYREAVRPILDAEFPGLPHSAALIGSGSEVLGFDTALSTDHHWGPRLLLFLDERDFERYRDPIHATLSLRLPRTFHEYPTNFTPPDPADNGTQQLQPNDTGPINHRVELLTAPAFFREYLAFDIQGDIELADWLTFPEQKLGTITAGAVYHDGVGLQAVRDRLAYYPRDVWLYLLAAGWARIGQEEHLMGRAGLAGDEIGSALIGSRLVRDLMRLCFLMERRYAPYPKWFGTAFTRLACAADLSPMLRRALRAETWPDRERHLCAAYGIVAALHNTLNITEALSANVSPFFNRPFQVIHADRFAAAIVARISDLVVKRLAERRLIGGVDQFSDSTDLLSDPVWRPMLRKLYT